MVAGGNGRHNEKPSEACWPSTAHVTQRTRGSALRDKPSPLYQLLVLTTLASTRISADIAVAAARELFHAGWRTPERMREATWQQRVDALGRAHYKRYDESTATKLGEAAAMLLTTLNGDLRRLRPQGPDEVDQLLQAIADFPRIGPVGAGIFVREVQDVWPVGPFFDAPVLASPKTLGLPTEPPPSGRPGDRHRAGQCCSAGRCLVKAAAG